MEWAACELLSPKFSTAETIPETPVVVTPPRQLTFGEQKKLDNLKPKKEVSYNQYKKHYTTEKAKFEVKI